MSNAIKIKGARVNNLKNIDLEIPRDKFVVVTGLSGSGKSSLVFDLIYAESQRRYMESLSSYARQFVGLMDKPDVDLIDGLIPAISIDQKSASNNPRSTVGTISEIYDYFRLLYTKIGIPHCPHCGGKMELSKSKKASGKKKEEHHLCCPNCNFKREEFRTIDFSFNSGQGACPECSGLGVKMEIDAESVLNLNLNIAQGSIKPWMHYNFDNQNNLIKEVEKLATRHGFDISLPLKKMSRKEISLILNGDQHFPGVLQGLRDKYQETDSNYIRQKISQYMKSIVCPACQGQRLKPEVLAVKFQGLNICELSSKNIEDLRNFFKLENKLDLDAGQKEIFHSIAKEVVLRLNNIIKVGLSYLTISRPATTLSGGESQRLRLSHQISSNLVGLLYVLDEPSIGLHPKDNENLIETLRSLNTKGNSVIVIEHDSAMMLASDYILDIGPLAGERGGEVIFAGDLKKFKKDKKSLTAQYLFGDRQIPVPSKYRQSKGKFLKIIGACENNLKNIDVEIPLENLVVISGVSGSGKSTLMIDILAKALNKKFYRTKEEPGKHQAILGLEHLDKIIDIDQSPIGRTPRSNPATYTGVFSYIRDIFASLPEAKKHGIKPQHFSFNLKGGRCEKCQGDGVVKVEMQFLPDIYAKCDECNGQRYKKEVLDIKYNGKNIYEVLEMTIEDALKFFAKEKNVKNKLEILNSIGLGYVKLGQSATTLSGGESQRIKLAFELSRPATGKTLYILDEPTTGLHFEDSKNLLKVLHGLVDKGNTVLVIEHNLDIIKSADWIIDLGPEGGDKGGEVVACGNPREVAKEKRSYTGKYLKEFFK